MYPKMKIDLKKIYENAVIVNDNCKKHNIDVSLVTKLHGANPEICRSVFEAGIETFADSRIDNLKNIQEFKADKWLIRLPMISEASDVIKYSDVSFNSEYETIKALDYEAKNQNKTHDILIMLDVGDLREGYFNEDDLILNAKKIKNLKNINIKGVATNLTCYGGVLPEEANMNKLLYYKNLIESELNLKDLIVSGGNSTSYTLVRENKMPKGINNLRIGDSIYFGRDCTHRKHIDGMNKDGFILEAEIIELKEKPSIPIGKRGFSALNTKPEFKDDGIRKRAILAVGKQDIDLDIFPLDEKIKVLGSSSDHLLVDITDSDNNYKMGDKIEFYMYYTAALRAFTSKYIVKEFLK